MLVRKTAEKDEPPRVFCIDSHTFGSISPIPSCETKFLTGATTWLSQESHRLWEVNALASLSIEAEALALLTVANR